MSQIGTGKGKTDERTTEPTTTGGTTIPTTPEPIPTTTAGTNGYRTPLQDRADSVTSTGNSNPAGGTTTTGNPAGNTTTTPTGNTSGSNTAGGTTTGRGKNARKKEAKRVLVEEREANHEALTETLAKVLKVVSDIHAYNQPHPVLVQNWTIDPLEIQPVAESAADCIELLPIEIAERVSEFSAPLALLISTYAVIAPRYYRGKQIVTELRRNPYPGGIPNQGPNQANNGGVHTGPSPTPQTGSTPDGASYQFHDSGKV